MTELVRFRTNAEIVAAARERTARRGRTLTPEQILEARDAARAAGLDIEVLSSLRRKTLRGEIPASDAREALDTLALLEVERHPLHGLLSRIWQMRSEISAYDAGYVALAEALDLPLLTLDRKLARTAERYCDVIVP
ncbi:MAG: type II toxin-antitoxin system VapC family toxin [Microbacterium sp.]